MKLLPTAGSAAGIFLSYRILRLLYDKSRYIISLSDKPFFQAPQKKIEQHGDDAQDQYG